MRPGPKLVATPKVAYRRPVVRPSARTTTCPSFAPKRRRRFARPLKRTIDVVGAGVLLAVTAPVFLVVALAVKIDSRGPVLFGQWRAGQNMRLFRI